MKDKFLKAINVFRMLSSGDIVIVGVSGGADSMCLLDLLNEHKEELGIKPIAAHVNHCLRGAQADDDEEFVKSFCVKKNIPFSSLRADINALCEKSGESAELCARKVRYDFFSSLGGTKIATAHTASDAVETMLMNLSRGAALNGLCSIPPVRDNIIRPLIYFLRSDTENYCREHGIDFVTDATNLTDDYTRNKYRHNVVSVLKEINPSFEPNAQRCIDSLRIDNDFLEEYAHAVFHETLQNENELDVCALSGYHRAVRRRVIADFLETFSKTDFENRHIELIDRNLHSSNFAQMLPGNFRVCISDGKMYFEKKTDRYVLEQKTFHKNDGLIVFANNKRISIFSDFPRKLSANEMAVDFYGINDIIIIRPRKAGDMLSLAARHCTKSLKKLFNEMKVPPEQRESIPVLSDESGIIWCAVGGVDDSRKINKDTKKYLIIKTEDCKNDG